MSLGSNSAGDGGSGCASGERNVSVPGRCNGDVDFNVVDDDDRGIGEVSAGGNRMDPRARFLPFINVTFILILKP